MSESIKQKVLNKIKQNPKGKLFFMDSFAMFDNDKATNKAVNKALQRLIELGELERIAIGIYVRPVIDKHIGKVLPSIEEIAFAIAKRDRARILPTGSFALYKLGLTTQIPLNLVYYSDTSARKIKIGNQTITFKKASSKNLSFVGELSKLAIQALRTIGKDKATEKEINQIRNILKKENPKHLQHDLLLAPVWIRKLIAPTK